MNRFRWLWVVLGILLPAKEGHAAVVGIDPLAVLDTQPKPNAVILLDSSGGMRETLEALASGGGISQGELVGSDPHAKLALAKQALQNVLARNESRMRFKLGAFSQNTADEAYFPPAGSSFVADRFYYATTDPAAASLAINPGGNGMTPPGLSRNTTRDTLTLAPRPGAMERHHYLRAGRFWNGETIVRTGDQWLIDGTAPVVRTNPATLRIDTGSGIVVFTFRGLNWFRANDTRSCSGFRPLVDLADCSTTDQLARGLSAPLADELDIDPDGSISGYRDGALGSSPAAYPPERGVRPVGGAPIGRALAGVREWFSSYRRTTSSEPHPPRTFVVVVAGSDDDCSGFDRSNDGDQTSADDDNALAAASEAQQLYEEGGVHVQTRVVALGSRIGVARANWIAWAGTGLHVATTTKNGVVVWSRRPKASDPEVVACKAAGGCADALFVKDADRLEPSLQAALEAGAGGATVSASPDQTASVYELGKALAGLDPLDDDKRYAAVLPISVQATFDTATYDAKLTAYATTSSSAPVAQWEAGTKLRSRVAITAPATFAALVGGGSSALVKRRIFTSVGNGVFTSALLFGTEARGSGVLPASLWPPDTATSRPVAPTNDTEAGLFDGPFGLNGDGGDGELTVLQSRFGACQGSPLPAACHATASVIVDGQPVDVRVARARREAREMILAYTAGAVAARDDAGRPARNNTGELLYTARRWLLGESTLATPAIAGPPAEGDPQAPHAAEYRLYRDGPRDEATHLATNGIDLGFGLRHPDRDGSAASRADAGLKPTMSVVYLATNRMLHAFRAGPCPTGVCADTGGEELWAFVPFDQLPKLADLMTRPPTRDPHTYMIAASPRLADVFVPAPGGHYTQSVGSARVGGTGKWRTILLFGRGAGGKNLTALDVTTPGPFTRSALDRVAPPLVLWSRGNPDTANTVPGNHDASAYAQMGETWSVPSVAESDPAANTTARTPAGVEHVAYVGSGYSETPGEGHTFYALDALTGDVVHAQDVGTRWPLAAGAVADNALVASPAVFAPSALGVHGSGTSLGRVATHLYIGDVQGRVWRFQLTPAFTHSLFYDFGLEGSTQPITTRAALIDFDGAGTGHSRPHVYVATGGDRRVMAGPFRIAGLRDDDADGATLLFSSELPDRPAPAFRGTMDPIAAFNDHGRARVFFGATRLSPAGANCLADTSTMLIALTAETGRAAFDLGTGSSDAATPLAGRLGLGLRIARTPTGHGRLMLSNAIGSVPESAEGPSPPAPPAPAPGGIAAASSDVFVRSIRMGTSVCR